MSQREEVYIVLKCTNKLLIIKRTRYEYCTFYSMDASNHSDLVLTNATQVSYCTCRWGGPIAYVLYVRLASANNVNLGLLGQHWQSFL